MVLDTNILISYLNEDEAIVEHLNTWFANHVALFVSAISYGEVLSIPEANPTDIRKMKEFLDNFIFVDINKSIAEMTAEIRKKSKLKFPDAAIVATAKYLDVSLVTRDKQLHKIKDISIIKI